ncbi:hypothetical protein ACRRTK_014461 [Alexandromys fortis]
MQSSPCVLSKWKNKYLCQLLFGSGVLVSLSLSGPQLERVVIDRSLVGKLISDTISDALLTDSFIILSFLAQNKLCFIQFTKKMDSLDVNKRLERLSALDYKVSYYDIPGPAHRTLERRLAINSSEDVVVCWWPLASDGAWPWTPISSEKDRANLLLLGFTQGGLQVLSSVRTEWNPLDVSFGAKQPHQVLTVECSIGVDKEPMADSCIYECVRNKLHCVSVTRIPLRSKAISCCRNPTEDKLVVGCEDSSLILYEAHRGATLLAQAELLPSLVSCHPSGAILLVGSSQGELQIFDIALAPINIQLLAEDRLPRETLQFNKFFDVSSSLVQMQWIASPLVSQKPERGEICDLLFLRFNRGPVGVLLFKLVALLLLPEVGKEAASVPAKLLHSRISCQSCLIYDWDLQCWTRAHESLGGYSVDSPNSQGIVKFYCLVHLGQFPRFPVKLGLVRRSTSILTRGQLGLVDLILQYLHCDEVNEAINILSSMSWDSLGQQCFISMSAIVNHLLRQRLTPEREAQLEASLGTFYAPTRPLLDTTVLEYRDPISKYARRFFHHLLRYRRFEKAFLLAVDIGARDLFMRHHQRKAPESLKTMLFALASAGGEQVKEYKDEGGDVSGKQAAETRGAQDIHYLALDVGERALAEAARRRACDIDGAPGSSGAGKD